MFNRRTFLKTSAAALPLTALHALNPASTLAAADGAVALANVPTAKLVPLPARLAAIDPAHQPWQQKVRRVGQSNMTEHDPAVMNVEEWADYWHSADADIVFISVTGILASILRRSHSIATENICMVATSSASVSPPPKSATCARSPG